MKIHSNLFFGFLLSIAFCEAQQAITVPSPTSYSIVSRSANSRVWEQTNYTLSAAGQIIPQVHSYTELASGLCYQQNGQWVDSQEQINILSDGTAAATNGQIQANFPVNIYDGVITLVTPDSLQLRSRPVGLSYDDGTNIVLIAALTNSVGELISSNQVIYTNAFVGVDADLLYTYRKGGFEQDVIFREQPPIPEQFGLSSDTCQLQMLTEFFNSPTPVESVGPVNPRDGLQDTTLDFGKMKMVQGHAFYIGSNSPTDDPKVLVYKSWTILDGRTLLVEQVPYQRIGSQLANLPLPAVSAMNSANSTLGKLSFKRLLPPRRGVKSSKNVLQLAKGGFNRRPAVILDYEIIDSDEDVYTFQGDTTYYISDEYFVNTGTFEGGTILKFDVNGQLDISTIIGNSTNYLPASLTSVNDNTIGQTISTSTGNPAENDSGTIYLNDGQNSGGEQFSNLRFLYAATAYENDGNAANFTFSDCQFVLCGTCVNLPGATDLTLDNDLFSRCGLVMNAGITLDANNLTVDQCPYFDTGGFGPNSGAINNSIFTGGTIIYGPYATNYCAMRSTNTGIFEVVGGGSYYLATNIYRGAGTTNIDADVLADLATKTTWPPQMVYERTNISALGTLSPVVTRDTNGAPDLGYHYDPLDWVFGGCNLSSNLTLTAGTAIGWFEDYGGGGESDQPYGISLTNGANLSFNGTATQPCYFARYAMVQEGENGNWTNAGSLGSNTSLPAGILYSSLLEPVLTAHFTKWVTDNTGANLIGYSRTSAGSAVGTFENCEFYNGGFYTSAAFQAAYFTNCLFFRTYAFFLKSGFTLENCTLYDGILIYFRLAGESPFFSVENSAFDGTAFVADDYLYDTDDYTNYTLFNYNAYNTNNLSWQTYPVSDETYGTLEIVGSNDVMVTNYDWQTSWFGNFYLPSDSLLITNGSTSAGVLGLYWFTTQTNQVPQSNNVVDIGYHYVATDTNGNPLDYYVPGTPNYLLDPDGPPTNVPPSIIEQPANQTVMMGSNATFSVTVEGSPSFSYQWYLNGTALSDNGGIFGSRSATLNLNGVMPDQAGYYSVVVSNNFGSVPSTNAILTVLVSQTNSYPQTYYILPPNAFWNVTDISDPAQPVSIGELQAPFSEPDYNSGRGVSMPLLNAPWHTNTTVTVSEVYGTTTFGGSGYGAVFKINSTGPPNGIWPNEMLLAGNVLFGTTAGLGGNNSGTVFQVNTNGTGFTTLYSFGNASQGSQPQAGMVLSGGALYGTTEFGGNNNNNAGTVFSINTNGTGFRVLYNFGDPPDGANPCAKLILCGNTLYGTTSGGGTYNKGTVFEINTNGSNSGYEVLHNFTGSDGEDPEAELLLSGGVLYGTTTAGGAHDKGVIFCINTNILVLTNLYSFGSVDNDGANPYTGLVLSGSTLYGTTANGGTNGYGTVFSVNASGGSDVILHSFDESNPDDGANPYGNLTLSGSILFGTTEYGGSRDCGMVFSINTSDNGFTNLYSFQDTADGQQPDTALALSDNTLFGTTLGDSTLDGDPNYGTMFSINTSGSNFTVLTNFSTADFAVIHPFNGYDGANPYSQLAMSGSTFYGIPTTVYGTTFSGGSNNYGTVFKVNTDGSGFADLYEFTGGNDGRNPQTGLLMDGNTLYGTTTNSIFRINTDGSDFSSLYNITNASQLILSLSGYTLYGTTSNGGANGYGTVFSIATDGSDFTNLHSFDSTDGAYPNGGLELYGCTAAFNGSTIGTLYGTTYAGGSSNDGTVFNINADGTDFTNLHEFNGNDGANPKAGLLLTNNNYAQNTPDTYYNGNTYLYGTTENGGTNGNGTVFGINTNGSFFQVLHSFNGAEGEGIQPEGRLVLCGQSLCGTTSGGGAYTNGTVFGINTDGSQFTDLYDFRGDGTNDGALPNAGLTLPVVDNLMSIWSADTTINLSSEEVSNVDCSIAVDNYVALFVNGTQAFSTVTGGGVIWQPEVSLAPYLQPGENDIRVVIAGDDDAYDYFAMEINYLSTNIMFGTTANGGADGQGTVFELTPGGGESILHSFSATDGSTPLGDLILTNNTLYGVTEFGGPNNGNGTIFSMNTNGLTFTNLHTFTIAAGEGYNPAAGLILYGNMLYGTTEYGGTNDDPGYGTIFSIQTNGTDYTILHYFAGHNFGDGANPVTPLLLVSNTLYGTTSSGGNNSDGTIFSIMPDGSGYTNLYSFGASGYDGQNPLAGLVLVSNTLYGTTYNGGFTNEGAIFKFCIGNTTDAVLYSFGTNQMITDGQNPLAGLLLGSNTLYGTTYYGGANSYGTIFSIGVDGNGYTNLQSFGPFGGNYYGEKPQADLIMLGNSLYGTTETGGAYNSGSVFSISPNGTSFIDLYDFSGNPSGGSQDGANPEGGLCSP